ncbi:hypothetical protein, partial [Nocardioides sp.]|uniref:hypothetical protein n=1 Tax=Nocardioides sp. TaxID=35761 RepID=UPI00271F7F7D
RATALVEAAVLGGAVAAGVLLGDAVAVRTVVDGTGLVPTGSSLPSLAAATSPTTPVVTAVVVAVGAALVVAAGAAGVRRLGTRRSEPRTLLHEVEETT